MAAGKVKWFDNTKGYGFIAAAEEGGKDVFVHHSVIEGKPGQRTLKDGEEVEYEADSGPKGLKATIVKRLNVPAASGVGGREAEEMKIRHKSAYLGTVRAGTPREAFCTADFPCLVNIFVLAGVDAPCAICAPGLDEMRAIDGWMKVGGYYRSPNITEDQQKAIDARVLSLTETE